MLLNEGTLTTMPYVGSLCYGRSVVVVVIKRWSFKGFPHSKLLRAWGITCLLLPTFDTVLESRDVLNSFRGPVVVHVISLGSID